MGKSGLKGVKTATLPCTCSRGVTLIELIMVILLVAVVSAVAAPFIFRGTSTVTAGAFARKVASDIRYAQTLSLVRSSLDTPSSTNPRFAYRIRFNVADPNCPAAAQYTIVNDSDNNGTWGENPNAGGGIESARVPATGDTYYCVRLDTGDYSGFTVSADFGGSAPGILEFDSLGVPYDSDGARLTAVKTVTVSKGGESVSITVAPNTGRVAVQ